MSIAKLSPSTHGAFIVHGSGLAIACALAGVLIAGVIQPAHAARRTLQQQRATLAAGSAELGNIEAAIHRARRDAVHVREQLESAVPLQDLSRLNRYTAHVMDVAKRSGVSVSEVTPGEYEPAHRDFGRVSIALQGEGAPEKVLAFLRDLHVGCRDVEVRGVTLSTIPGSASLAQYSMQLLWYTLPAHAPQPEAASEQSVGGRTDRAEETGRAGGDAGNSRDPG